MARYAALRLLQAVPVLIGITFVSFLLIHLTPGDPARAVLGVQAEPQAVEAMHRELGLDRPLLSQYGDFLEGAVQFDFGTSIKLNASVSSLIGSHVMASVWLVAYGTLIALAIAVPLAVISARRHDRAPDHAIRIGGMVLYAMPPFWLGLLLVLVFGLELGWLPTSGYGDSPGQQFRSLTLPALTIGLIYAPLLLRTLRASLLETLDADFVEAARARGLTERRVLYRHVLRNSSIPTITLAGLLVGFLVSATVVIENVFSIPGLGSLLVSAVQVRDFPLIQGLTVVFALAVVIINLITDMVYALVDPRVRL
jgi:peptide/nickel transport system permease protein